MSWTWLVDRVHRKGAMPGTTVNVPAEDRQELLDLARDGNVTIVSSDRYTAVVRVNGRDVHSHANWPRRDTGRIVAHVLLDWDAQLAAGTPVNELAPDMPDVDDITNVTALAAWVTESPSFDAGWVRDALQRACEAYASDGPYGSDIPIDSPEHESLAALLADELHRDSYNDLDMPALVATVLANAHLITTARLINRVQLPARREPDSPPERAR